MLQRATKPTAAVVRALTRPGSYPGHARELTSTAVTAAMWPLGLVGWSPPSTGATTGVTGRSGRRREPLVSTPVLLVHGFGANKSNWFFLRRHLEQAGFGHIDAIDYNPLRHDIPTLADRCAQRARALMDRHGVDRVHLIGHSLGGVLVRYAIQVLDLEGVGVAATVCSPHGGIRPAGWGASLPIPRHGAAPQLDPAGAVMTELRRTSRALPTRFVAYYSNLDLVVPARRARIVEPQLSATNILVKDHGHLSIMLSRRLATSVTNELAAAEGLAGFVATPPDRSVA
jgi:triacylglycerol lipase